MRRVCGWGVLAWLCAVCCMAAEENPLDRVRRTGVVARVDTGTVTLADVLENWGPVWAEILGDVQTGRLSVADGDAKLQKQWEEAVETALRDEMLYQEAKHQTEENFQAIVDKYFQAQGRSGNRQSRYQVEQRLRRQHEKAIEEMVRSLVERNIRAAGGYETLSQILKSRDLSLEEWKERLIRKAFTFQFIYMRLQPLGRPQPRPREVLTFYKDNPDLFTEPGTVVFRHILFDQARRGGEDAAYNAAASVYEAIRDGRITFVEAVAKHSDDAVSKANKGLEERISTDPDREAWLSEVRSAVKEETPGALGPILVSPRGSHIVELVRVEPGRKIPYREAQKEIIAKMESKRWEEDTDKLVAELKTRVSIEIMMPRVPEALTARSVLSRSGGMLPTRRIGLSADPLRDESEDE